MKKIDVVGAGRVGESTAHNLAEIEVLPSAMEGGRT